MSGASISDPPRSHRHSDLTILCWSFVTGAVLVLSFILLYVEFKHFNPNQFLWEVDVRDLMVTLIGAGLLVGCVAVITNYFMRSRC